MIGAAFLAACSVLLLSQSLSLTAVACGTMLQVQVKVSGSLVHALLKMCHYWDTDVSKTVWIITVGHRPFAEPQTLMAER